MHALLRAFAPVVEVFEFNSKMEMREMWATIKHAIRRIPVVGPILTKIWVRLHNRPFPGSAAYWEERYSAGGNSGDGSYGDLAQWKAEVVNAFIRENDVASVLDFGCGDSNQLTLASYPAYIGLDVSRKALELCRCRFQGDKTKTFFLYDDFFGEPRDGATDLSLSMDVIFHLVEEDVYRTYMSRLFSSARRFVIIYSSDFDKPRYLHERHWAFSSWVEANRSDWTLVKRIPNKYPYNLAAGTGSLSEFCMYRRK